MTITTFRIERVSGSLDKYIKDMTIEFAELLDCHSNDVKYDSKLMLDKELTKKLSPFAQISVVHLSQMSLLSTYIKDEDAILEDLLNSKDCSLINFKDGLEKLLVLHIHIFNTLRKDCDLSTEALSKLHLYPMWHPDDLLEYILQGLMRVCRELHNRKVLKATSRHFTTVGEIDLWVKFHTHNLSLTNFTIIYDELLKFRSKFVYPKPESSGAEAQKILETYFLDEKDFTLTVFIAEKKIKRTISSKGEYIKSLEERLLKKTPFFLVEIDDFDAQARELPRKAFLRVAKILFWSEGDQLTEIRSKSDLFPRMVNNQIRSNSWRAFLFFLGLLKVHDERAADIVFGALDIPLNKRKVKESDDETRILYTYEARDLNPIFNNPESIINSSTLGASKSSLRVSRQASLDGDEREYQLNFPVDVFFFTKN